MLTPIEEITLLTSSRFLKQKEYWATKLNGWLSTRLPAGEKSSQPQTNGPRREETVPFSPQTVKGLMRLTRGSHLPLYIFLLTALKALIHRYTHSEDISVRSPVFKSKITAETLNDSVFIRVPLSHTATFKELLYSVRQAALEAFENQDYPFGNLIDYLHQSGYIYENDLQTRSNVDCRLLNIHGSTKESPNESRNHGMLIFSLREDNASLSGHISYQSQIYDTFYVKQIARHFASLLESALANIDQPISDIPYLSDRETRHLLVNLNDTYSHYPHGKTLHRLFEEQVEQTPDRTALVFDNREMTYRQLNEKANRLARLLTTKNSPADSPATQIPTHPQPVIGIMVERSFQMIAGILAILKAGGIYLPIEPDYPAERINYMLKDSRAQLLLTHPNLPGNLDFDGEVIDIDNDAHYPDDHSNPNTALTANAPAYIIYTSGSTGKPKGVLVGHASVVNLAVAQKQRFHIEADERILQFSSISFDASVEQIFISLFSGAALVLIDTDTLADCGKFELFIKRHAITHIHAVPSFLAQMNLKSAYSLKRVIAGGDVCPVSLAREWTQSPNCSFFNEYGPTESTVTSIEMQVSKVDDNQAALSIGTPLNNTTVYILDRNMQPVPIGAEGQLYIGGVGVAYGYINRPELTAEKFVKNPHAHQSPLNDHLIYHTGDRARRLKDGNIEFLGRDDNQVKIRGFRIEPGEIENRLLAHEAIKEAVVTALTQTVDLSGQEPHTDHYLCAYIVTQREVETSQLIAHLAMELPDYMIPAFFVTLREIPVTLTGKIDRNALPIPEIKKGNSYIAPQDELQEELAEIWARLLQIDKGVIGIDSNFFELGGHSLNATMLIAKIHKTFDVNIPLSELFKNNTVRQLATYIKGVAKTLFQPITPAASKEFYPLSPAQNRLYILQQINPTDTTYNMPLVFPLKTGPQHSKLHEAFTKLIQRHESLRTSFQTIDGQPLQKIHPHVDFDIEIHDTRDNTPAAGAAELIDEDEEKKSIQNIIRAFVRPFHLAHAPLLRVGLINAREGRKILVVDLHHIISDGVSHDILERDFLALFHGNQLPPLKLQYKDYTEWQNRQLANGVFKKQEEYWLETFAGYASFPDLPIDYPRTHSPNKEGRVSLDISNQLNHKIKTLVLETNSTLFIFFMAVYNILLSKYTNRDDIVVGAPIAGRNHEDLTHIIGMFVNMIALRNFPQPGKTFLEFLEEVKETSLNAFENQDYQFEELVNKLQVPREFNRNPLTDTVFVMQKIETKTNETTPLVDSFHQPVFDFKENQGAKFDITFVANEKQDTMRLDFDYRINLFKKETMGRMSRHLLNITEIVTNTPHVKIAEIQMLDSIDDEQLKKEFIETTRNRPTEISGNPGKPKIEAGFDF